MDNLNELQNLLNQVEIIVKKYDDLALQSGEKFNVFDIIGIRNDEVRMHSAMLANLLDAQGSHGMKGKFLELFIKMLEEKKSLDKKNNFKDDPIDFVIDSSYCIKEEHNYENGRIDLVIKKGNGECPFLIENKINARERDKQLINYNNAYTNAKILFLTLYGTEPTSHKDDKEKDLSNIVYCISYKTDILNWLEICHKEASDKPLIREGIKHYINLIKIITNQTMDNISEIELRKIIDKNLTLVNKIQTVNYNLITEFNFNNLIYFLIELTNELNIDIYKEDLLIPKNIGQKDSKLSLFKYNTDNEMYLWFDSKFNADNGRELWLYIKQSKIELKNTKEKLKEFKDIDELENEIGIPFDYYNKKSWDLLIEENNIKEAADFIRNLNS